MTFGLFAGETAAKLENARLNPLDTSEPPSALTGIARGVGLGLMRGGAKAGEALILAATAPNVLIDKAFGTRSAEPYFEFLADSDPVAYWTPDPRDVGAAGQVLGGLAEIAIPLAAGGGSPNLLLATTQLSEAKRLVDEGVDAETAGVVGAQQAVGLGVGFRVPFFGRNFIERAFIAGAGVNVLQGALSRGWSYKTLKDAGYQSIADQYDPGNFEAAAIDVLTGVAFGTIAHLGARGAPRVIPELTTEQTDALLTANAAKHLEVDHAPGALDPAGRTQHVEAMRQAVDQLTRGEKVDVASIVDGMRVEEDRFLAKRRAAWAAEVEAELKKLRGEQPEQGAAGDVAQPVRRPGGDGEVEAQARADAPVVADQAKADAGRLSSLDGLVANDDGTIDIDGSQAFIRRFLAGVASPDGALTEALLTRMRNAIFEKAYGDADLAKLVAQSTDASVKNVLGGLMRIAPVMARMRDFVEAGALAAEFDLTQDIAWAVRTFSRLRAEGRPVNDFTAQQALSRDPDVTPARINLLTAFEQNGHSAKRVADFLSRYERAVQAVGRPDQGSISIRAGEVPTRANLLADAIEGVRADHDVQAPGGVFDAAGEAPEVVNAKQVIADDPELRIVDEDGNEITAVEALKRADETIRQAAQDAKGFEAAVNCLLVNA